jgi:hypothetical protein
MIITVQKIATATAVVIMTAAMATASLQHSDLVSSGAGVGVIASQVSLSQSHTAMSVTVPEAAEQSEAEKMNQPTEIPSEQTFSPVVIGITGAGAVGIGLAFFMSLAFFAIQSEGLRVGALGTAVVGTLLFAAGLTMARYEQRASH